MSTQYGTVGPDLLTGSNGDDILQGGPAADPASDTGADTLQGLGGNDVLHGYGGDDMLDGGAGTDQMFGGTGSDTYVVNRVTDSVIELANAGYDTVLTYVDWTLGANVEALRMIGGAGAIGTGNALDNLIQGNAGDNSLFGLEGKDRLEGGAGNDRLEGGQGIDTLVGGDGDDVYVIDSIETRWVHEDLGFGHNVFYPDRIVEQSGGGLDMVLWNTRGDTESNQVYEWRLPEQVELLVLQVTSDAGFHFLGNDLDNTMTGSDGDDTLSGGGGLDVLNGGAGNDSLTGEYMVGGTGNDIYTVTATSDVVVERAEAGIDTVRSAIDLTLARYVENLELTGEGLVGRGNGLDNVMSSSGGHNFLRGLGGNDTLQGSGDGDRLYGGVGDDLYLYTDGDKIIEVAGEGYDTLQVGRAGGWSTGPSRVVLAENVEKLLIYADSVREAVGTAGHDTIDTYASGDVLLSGLGGNDVLRARNGGAILDGGAGDDIMIGTDSIFLVDSAGDVVQGSGTVRASTSYTLASAMTLELGVAATGTGSAGNDRLVGSAGDDVLLGMAGADTLVGSLGADRLTGGEGSDQFFYASAIQGGDIITDFTAGADELHVSAAGFGGGLFIGISLEVTARYVANATGSATSAAGTGQFVMDTSSDTLWWDANGQAAGGATMLARFETPPVEFSAQDIFVGF